jgi:SAM-dependent methyltransferase
VSPPIDAQSWDVPPPSSRSTCAGESFCTGLNRDFQTRLTRSNLPPRRWDEGVIGSPAAARPVYRQHERVGDDFKHLVASGYDRIAERYADWSPATPSGPKTKYLNVALRLVPSGGTALDLGCGTGQHLTRHLARHYRVTGVDISPRSVALAREQVPDAVFVVADMATLDLAPESFDLITAFYSLIHVPRTEHRALLGRIRSWLRPGGVLIATMAAGAGGEGIDGDWLGTPMYWSNWDAHTNRRLISAAGLDLLEAAEETELEGDEPITHLWVVAQRHD